MTEMKVGGYAAETWKAEEINIPETPWIQAFEHYRWNEFHQVYPRRTGDTRPLDARAADKRNAHKGGDINHRFEGERYVNCTDKEFRRKQLRKLVDEGGEISVGGQKVSHPMLSRWESYAYGVTKDEVDALEREDANPAALISRGWWCYANRTSDWRVSFGSSMVGEGGTAQMSKQLLAGVEEDRKRLAEWGVQDLDRALMNRWEHAGIDVDHAQMAYDAADLIDDPEMQEEARQVCLLRMHDQARGY
jgi:hypothetical protein